MVELIKKREENQRMLKGHCGLLRHGRIIRGKHTSRSHSSLSAGGNPKPSFASCSLCCLCQPSSLLQLSTKIHGIFAVCPEGITSHHARAGDPISPGSSRNCWDQSHSHHKLGRMHKPSLSQDHCSLSHIQIK